VERDDAAVVHPGAGRDGDGHRDMAAHMKADPTKGTLSDGTRFRGNPRYEQGHQSAFRYRGRLVSRRHVSPQAFERFSVQLTPPRAIVETRRVNDGRQGRRIRYPPPQALVLVGAQVAGAARLPGRIAGLSRLPGRPEMATRVGMESWAGVLRIGVEHAPKCSVAGRPPLRAGT